MTLARPSPSPLVVRCAKCVRAQPSGNANVLWCPRHHQYRHKLIERVCFDFLGRRG